MRGFWPRRLAFGEIEIGGFGVHRPETDIEPRRAPRRCGNRAARHDDVCRILAGQRAHEHRTALELKPLAPQGPQDDLDPRIKPLAPVFGAGLEHGEFAGHVTGTENHPHPPAGNEIEHRDLLGHHHRIVQRQDHRAQTELDVPGHRRHRRGQRERLRQVAIIGAVMLHQIDAGDADRIGECGHFNRGAIQLGARRTPIGGTHVESNGGVDLFHW